MEKRTLTCINCPLGCQIEVTLDGGTVQSSTGTTCKPLTSATLMQTLNKYDLNAHSFRHTHATMLIEAGASLKGVAGRLGHKRVEMTDEVYTHNTQKIQQDTEKAFEKTLETMQTKR